eukprot:TRINITY_DN3446_c0_g1_i3.p3 TRINITY_DN3446_c0_g1~~TRINITY_DN3446_c0_g1_i3.p3  ORF type:complete len:62 (-),score=4.78 TRINITY_DN3446_c0_g1_i3:302-487(-)
MAVFFFLWLGDLARLATERVDVRGDGPVLCIEVEVFLILVVDWRGGRVGARLVGRYGRRLG